MCATYIHHALEWVALCALLYHFKYKNTAFTLLLFLLYFYRSDYSLSVLSSRDIVSPCEGTVLAVQGNKVSVFLSPFNRHFQVAPYAGHVTLQVYKPGEFHPANLLEKSNKNERMDTTLQTVHGTIVISQIAGVLARSIVSFVEPRQRVERGQPIGLIKFGSRVDVQLPNNATVLVRVGDKVRIGQVIAQL